MVHHALYQKQNYSYAGIIEVLSGAPFDVHFISFDDILAEPEDPGFEREIGQNINSIIQFNKSEQTGSDITEFYLSGFPDAAVPLLPRFEENFHVQVRTFPEYTPAEITLPENMRPAEYCILLGSLIRYSN